MIKMHPGVLGISYDLSVYNEMSGNIYEQNKQHKRNFSSQFYDAQTLKIHYHLR